MRIYNHSIGGSTAEAWARGPELYGVIDQIDPGDVVWLSVGGVDELVGLPAGSTAWNCAAIHKRIVLERPWTRSVWAGYNREITERHRAKVPWDYEVGRFFPLSFRHLDRDVMLNPHDAFALHLRPEDYDLRAEQATYAIDFLDPLSDRTLHLVGDSWAHLMAIPFEKLLGGHY